MDDLPTALRHVYDAERAIRGLMERALAERRYADLNAVAPIAQTLAELLHERQASIPADYPAGAPPASSSPHPRPARAARDDYPRFRRDNDRLVKIAWSKRDRREYLHRAPRAAVFRVAQRLTQLVPAGKTFAMDRVLPVKDESGNEIPAYQVYLALAWFRAMGAVRERGKEGYAAAHGMLDPERLEDAWNNLE
jgi:hypothetical protein